MAPRKRKFVPNPEWGDRMAWPWMTSLAFDCSISSTGWSLVSFRPYRRPVVVEYGTMRTENEGKLNQEQILRRSGDLYKQARAISSRYVVNRVAFEVAVPGSFGVASQSGAIAATAIQAAMIEAHPLGVEFGYHTPNHVKKVAALNGRAEKREVKTRVFEWLGTEFRTNTDVTDSIAVAITDAIDLGIEVPHDY